MEDINICINMYGQYIKERSPGRDAQGSCGGRATNECGRSGDEPLAANEGGDGFTSRENSDCLLALLTDQFRQAKRIDISGVHVDRGLGLATGESDELGVNPRAFILETEDRRMRMDCQEDHAILLDAVLRDKTLDHLDRVER